MEPKRVAIIGTGPIGVGAADALLEGSLPGLALLGVLTESPTDELLDYRFASAAQLADADVIVEAASHGAVHALIEPLLAAGKTVVLVSTGALADTSLRERLLAAAAAGGGKIVVPSGAVGALDLVVAAAGAGLDEVIVEQRKPPSSLLPADEAVDLTAPTVVFDGTVAEVVTRFPKTTNVAASVALAGLGFERTRALVVADPALRANQVRLTLRGSFGEAELTLANVPSANPKTSAIVAHSVIATLARLGSPLVIPG